MLPPPLLARAARARKIVEVGAGARFETATELARCGAEILVTDVDARVLAAPAPLLALLHDVHDAPAPAMLGADVVLSVRPPEEIQLACAKLARALDADLALRPLKDEWADISASFRRHVVWPDGWRYFASKPER